MDPELAVAVGRYFDRRNSHAGDTGGVGFDTDRAGAGDDAQRFECSAPGHQVSVRLHHHRHAPHDAVCFRLDGQHAAARSGQFEGRNVA